MHSTVSVLPTVAERLDAVRERIRRAASRAGRHASAVRLVAVTKTCGVDAIREAYAAGQIEFGENRVQELLAKKGSLSSLPVQWHLLGHLQSNKVRKAVPAADVVHSADSVELLARIDAMAAEAGNSPRLLVQVNLSAEPAKSGVCAEEALSLLERAAGLRHARVVGLMTLPPAPVTPEDSREWFRRLRELRDSLLAAGIPPAVLTELSMGMSGDFEVAVEEGATIVRVGSAIFGARQPHTTRACSGNTQLEGDD